LTLTLHIHTATTATTTTTGATIAIAIAASGGGVPKRPADQRADVQCPVIRHVCRPGGGRVAGAAYPAAAGMVLLVLVLELVLLLMLVLELVWVCRLLAVEKAQDGAACVDGCAEDVEACQGAAATGTTAAVGCGGCGGGGGVGAGDPHLEAFLVLVEGGCWEDFLGEDP
jgi:hypothetical protein